MPARIVIHAEAEPSDAVVFLAFPSAGSAAPIAAQYLIRNLSLPLVGQIVMPELVGLSAIREGLATSPLQIFGGDVVCKLGKDCPRMYVIASDVPLPAPIMMQAMSAIMEWAKAAHLVVGLDAVVRSDDDDVPDVFGASADPSILDELKAAKIVPLPRAVLAGTTAQLLLGATKPGRTAALIVEADPEQPDGRAAAVLLSALDRIVPDVDIDAGPLAEEAAAMEREIRSAQATAMRQGAPTGTTFI